MEVVLTSNLVSSEAEKIITAYNFQTIPINSFFVPNIKLYKAKYKAICSFMMTDL